MQTWTEGVCHKGHSHLLQGEGEEKGFGVREISICYKKRRLESFCHKRVSHLLHVEGKQKVFVVNEFHYMDRRCLS